MLLIPLYLFCRKRELDLVRVGCLLSRHFANCAVVVQLMMFMAPVFYPVSNIPENIRAVFYLNPLTYFVESFRPP